jgi:hypothetical protein
MCEKRWGSTDRPVGPVPAWVARTVPALSVLEPGLASYSDISLELQIKADARFTVSSLSLAIVSRIGLQRKEPNSERLQRFRGDRQCLPGRVYIEFRILPRRPRPRRRQAGFRSSL